MSFDVSTIKSLDVFSYEVQGKQTGLGLVINGTPYMLWTHVYKNLEMEHTHALKVFRRLKSNHYLSMTRSDLDSVLSRCATVAHPKFNSSAYYFISKEGFNRAVMEIDTSLMNDRDIAEMIDKQKDKMAAVFTHYESGTLALPAPKQQMKKLAGGYPVVNPIFKDRKALGKGIGLDEYASTINALKDTEEITGVNLQRYIEMVPAPKENPADNLITSTSIAERFGVSKNRAYKFLADNFLVERFGKDWILTDEGKKYGRMVKTTISSTDGRVIPRVFPKWTAEVMKYLRKNNAEKGQKLIC